MYRTALLFLLPVLFCGMSLQAQEQQTSIVHFSLDSDELTPEAQIQLETLLSEIQQLDRWKLDVRAHTDATGTDQYNEALAGRRAAAVRQYLVDRDLPLEQVSISTFGEHRPADSNTTEEGRRRNRRVEIDLYTWPLNTLADLMGSLEDLNTQKFTFQADQAVSLTGSDGTTVWVPSEVFVHADGRTAQGTIELEMREAYSYADMVAAGLSTHSGTEMLETGGMVYLEARSEGEKLQIREGGELILGMPTEQQLPGMQLFTGTTDANGNLTDWNPTGQAFQKNKTAVLRIAEPPAMPKIKTELTLFKYDKSGEPTPPTEPGAPTYPKEPNRESIQYNPGFFKRLFMGRKKIEAREDAIYAKKVAQYEARLERYPALKQAYALEMEEYALELDGYRQAKATYEDGLKEQWEEHQQARREKYKDAITEAEEKYRRTLQAYQEYKARKIAEYEVALEKGSIDQRSLNNYFFAVNKMGWINCDRFYNVAASEKEPLLVMDEDEQEEMIFVLFTDIRSALRTSRAEGFYTTQSVPTGANAKVIGLKVQDGRPLLAVKEITVGELDQIELDYKPRRLAEIRQTLAALD